MTDNPVSIIILLSIATLLPFLIAARTCYLKFSIVFVMVRNAIGVQQVPSNMVLNAIALILSLLIMAPLAKNFYLYSVNYQTENPHGFTDPILLDQFLDESLQDYRQYLHKYADPELVNFFVAAQERVPQPENQIDNSMENGSLIPLLAAYALSEIKSAFIIGFYLYLPFVVIDLVVSSILLALGMMMMSPITLSVPIKLVLFVAMDGWSLLSKGLISQYLDLMAVK
ncbi:EscR/YscR/HrcR family type III secretion system export apparatus protein [Arsenophonus nasoniae]|uniref:EscR/YscR/HrcR family type III secretion system export apparatus protein n=1 Tax=Arsenophonus nasoniae TaxID=638 RepID=A0AA95GNF6_9GAMM|nr:EscR/YscR/HrcR family type III secretion system export apparatus protein [Arsenophonus nasoniae]WGM01723.1 EscR/YscR/HrcR family type III secretion system export apparatus protein [Arsenophonus nasoniae]